MATSKVLKPRRGSTAEHSTFKGLAFEITFDTDKKTIVAHDGLTMGGFPLAHEAAVTETAETLRDLIEQKISENKGVTSSELQALDSALRSLINSQAQQQSTRDASQDSALTALDSALRSLIAQEVAKCLSRSGGTMLGPIKWGNTDLTSVDDTLTWGGKKVDTFPSGTKMLFNQSAAPTGWTKQTTVNDSAVRIVSGASGGSTGGSVAFSTLFTTGKAVSLSGNVGATTLTVAQMPSHTHPFSAVLWTPGSGDRWMDTGGQVKGSSSNTSATGGGGSHTHALSGTATIALNVKYTDVIICSKG